MISKDNISIQATMPKNKRAILEKIANGEGYKLSQFVKKILLDFIKKESEGKS